jgi:DMSO/TMAO reductase YedYZ molybdopterin-dependent catalytic subunit
MTGKFQLRIVASLLISLAPASLCQNAKQEDLAVLTVDGAVERPLKLQVADLMNMAHESVQVKDHEGNPVSYTGVALADLLLRAGAPLGEKLRGANMVTYVVAHAKDGYRVVFTLAELDHGLADSRVLVAYAVNEKPLTEGQGPLRMIVPGDKRPARWIRMLQRLEVVKIP